MRTDPISDRPSSAKLLCGIVPADAVALAVGDRVAAREATGRLRTDDTGHVNGDCTISDPDSTDATPAFYVQVLWPPVGQQNEVKRDAAAEPAYTFPTSEGTGFANYTGSGDEEKSAAAAGLVRGDYVLSVVINKPAKGRDPLRDAAAIMSQVVTRLDLPATPVPSPSASGGS